MASVLDHLITWWPPIWLAAIILVSMALIAREARRAPLLAEPSLAQVIDFPARLRAIDDSVAELANVDTLWDWSTGSSTPAPLRLVVGGWRSQDVDGGAA